MDYTMPSYDLLNRQLQRSEINKDYVSWLKARVQNVINDFSVNATVKHYKVSPISVVLEVELSSGTRFRKVKGLSREIEIELGTPIKIYQASGSTTSCFVSVPHDRSQIARIRDLIEDEVFQESESNLLIAAGYEEGGAPVYIDLELVRSPHMLIAGTTGSGKTVFLDDIIVSLLYKSSPDDVRMVLIDPTDTDFKVYNPLPHLLCPVLHNKAEINNVIRMLYDEIKKRNNEFATVGVKTLKDYNAFSSSKKPAIVVIIDKIIKLSQEMPKEFRKSLREVVAQGRSAGVHVIINTQSANTKYIDSTTKANLAVQAAFSVASARESRMAIDRTGAQKLTNPGELLLVRGTGYSAAYVKAPYISISEIKSVVDEICSNNPGKVNRPYEKVHTDYHVKENIIIMMNAVKHLSITARTNVFMLSEALDIDLPEAYEVIDNLEYNDLIEPIVGRYHRVNYEKVMEVLSVMESDS